MKTRIPAATKRRSRRLRKKLRLAEFKEEGFGVTFKFSDQISTDEQADVLFLFIGEVVEPRGLLFGGGEQGFVTRAGRGSASDEDRDAVRAWLQGATHVHSVHVAALEDAWWGPTPSEA